MNVTFPSNPPTCDYRLKGYRSHEGVARFDLSFEQEPVLRNADWRSTWKIMHKLVKPSCVEAIMRSALA